MTVWVLLVLMGASDLSPALEPPESCDSVSHLSTGGGWGWPLGAGAAVRAEMQLWGQHREGPGQHHV